MIGEAYDKAHANNAQVIIDELKQEKNNLEKEIKKIREKLSAEALPRKSTKLSPTQMRNDLKLAGEKFSTALKEAEAQAAKVGPKSKDAATHDKVIREVKKQL